MAEIAYYLSKNYWNRGITGEASRAVVKFGFEELGLHRIQTTVLPENIYSLQLLKKIVFREEGLLRQYLHGTEFKDSLMLAMLKEDFNDRQSR
jgi:ribosomal-protein-alanine N-acetyltransferase